MTAPDSAGHLRIHIEGHSDREWFLQERNKTLAAELAEARAKLARVEALHKRMSGMAWDFCEECQSPWPCPTYEAIHGDAAGKEG